MERANAAQYTPRPWEAQTYVVLNAAQETGWTIKAAGCDDTIADVFSGEHDARLIAAAPELLEALQFAYESILRDACVSGDNKYNKPLNIARAAIAKAIGFTNR